ncbi:MAG: Gldg family protein [bacterium]
MEARQSRFWKLTGGALGLIMVLAILVAANVILSQFRLRKDLTAEKLYTLSDGTRQILKKMDSDVTLMFFFNSSAPEVPAPLKTFAQQVEDLLREYEAAADGRIHIEKYDPKPDSDAEDLAQRYGVEGQTLPPAGPTLFIGLVARSGDRQETIPLIDPRTGELLEYNITRLIHRVTTTKKPIVGVMSPLPVLGSKPSPYMPMQRQKPAPAWAAFKDLSQDYGVRPIAPTAVEIDPDVDTLVVVHPKSLSDKSLFAIDQFVLRGGRLLAFVDPFCVADQDAVSNMDPYGGMGVSRASTLGKLFDAWGLKFETGKVVADIGASTPIRGRDNAVEQSPLYLSLRKDNLTKDDVLTAPVNSLLMVMAGAFTGDAAPGLKLTPLIASSPKSVLADAMMLQFDPNAFRRELKSPSKSYNLAIRLQGKFKTAFPEGAPAEPGSTNAVKTADTSSLKENQGNGNVILVADVDLLVNDFCVQELNLLGYRGYQPINDNINLFANMVEQMAGSADLIGVRCRGAFNRPFTRVLALQAEAQSRWMEQEQALEEKLQASQRRIEELGRQKDDKQRFILSPEQNRELEGIRAEVLKYKQELKQVRRNLREDIEALGMTIKVINILLVPALVALAGIIFALVRRPGK